MSEPYPPERDLIPCCVHLRTKTQFFMPDELAAGPGFVKVTTTGTYWCSQTHASFGPDDRAGTPHTCQPGRTCYEREARTA